MGNKLYQRRQTQEDWNGRSTATASEAVENHGWTRKLVRRQTREGKTWDRSGNEEQDKWGK